MKCSREAWRVVLQVRRNWHSELEEVPMQVPTSNRGVTPAVGAPFEEMNEAGD